MAGYTPTMSVEEYIKLYIEPRIDALATENNHLQDQLLQLSRRMDVIDPPRKASVVIPGPQSR